MTTRGSDLSLPSKFDNWCYNGGAAVFATNATYWQFDVDDKTNLFLDKLVVIMTYADAPSAAGAFNLWQCKWELCLGRLGDLHNFGGSFTRPSIAGLVMVFDNLNLVFHPFSRFLLVFNYVKPGAPVPNWLSFDWILSGRLVLNDWLSSPYGPGAQSQAAPGGSFMIRITQ